MNCNHVTSYLRFVINGLECAAMNRAVLFVASSALLAAGCVSTARPIPSEWLSVPATARIASMTLDDDGKVTPSSLPAPSPLADGPIRVVSGAAGTTMFNREKVLAEKLGAVDSLDLSESRGEVAFSAMHDGNYDIALISTDGGAVHWMPNDPADEVAVQWAPRGNKISYVIRASGGDIVRTLHIPSSYQFAIPFPNGTIDAVAWDPKAEHYAVAYSTLDASDRVEVLEYDGDNRKVVLPPQRQLDVEIVPLAFGAVVLHPRDLRRGEKLPLVIWVADDFGWSDARAALLGNARAAVVVTKQRLEDGLWPALRGMPWIETENAFIVDALRSGPLPPANSTTATWIAADPSLQTSQYRRGGNIVTVAPAVVQSFAAGYIAAQLKRTTPTNGSSR
jgi:hypothetical protein